MVDLTNRPHYILLCRIASEAKADRGLCCVGGEADGAKDVRRLRYSSCTGRAGRGGYVGLKHCEELPAISPDKPNIGTTGMALRCGTVEGNRLPEALYPRFEHASQAFHLHPFSCRFRTRQKSGGHTEAYAEWR